jgi:VWFA-related protein
MAHALSVRYIPTLALLLAAAVAVAGQAPRQPTPAPAVPTLKANAQLVVVDIVVTDKNQKPVPSLKLSDFTLTEDNKPQAVSHFEEHTTAGVAKMAATTKLPAGIFTNDAPAVTGWPVNVLLLDAVNTPPDGQAQVRDQLIKYLKKIRPGTPMAIYGLASHLTVLQGITSDPNVLNDPATLARIQDFRAAGRHVASMGSPDPEAPGGPLLLNSGPEPDAFRPSQCGSDPHQPAHEL